MEHAVLHFSFVARRHTGVRYISSLPAEVKRIVAAVRGHRGIENGMHWVLDVAFREDRNRAPADHAQENLGIFRRTALTLLKNTERLKGSVFYCSITSPIN